MAEKRMLIVDAEVVKKIDENRGDMDRSEFLHFLIDSQLKEDVKSRSYVDKEEFQQFAQGMKELLHNFLEFFISYEMELGKQPADKNVEELSQQLQAMDSLKGKGQRP